MVQETFEAVVIGSGFGGAVSTYRLAQAGLEVCLLERGRAYPPDSFPRSPADFGRSLWDPSEGLLGLFNYWSFSGLEALVSSGLGGGSLIYANVLLPMEEDGFFTRLSPDATPEPWPIDRDALEPHYQQVRKMLTPQPFPDHKPYKDLPKVQRFRAAGIELGLTPIDLPLAVSFAGSPGEPPAVGAPIRERVPNLHGVHRTTCRLCGECDIGCTAGAKNTLDYTYLSAAKHTGKVDLRTNHEVRSIQPDRQGGGWLINYVVHGEDDGKKGLSRRLPEQTMHARLLVLAAGTLGTTFLLLKSQQLYPELRGLSPALGSRFCGNGDLLGFIDRCRTSVKPGARPLRLDPSHGPVITSAFGVSGNGRKTEYYIQDGGYPEFIGWLLEGRDAPGLLRRLGHFAYRRLLNALTNNPRSDYGAELSALLGDGKVSSSTLPLLGIGHDVPDGVMSIRGGYLQARWSTRTSQQYFERVRASMVDISRKLNGRFIDDPLWHLRQRVITVHPLGGCPMSDDPRRGVVDGFGRVWGYSGLYVVDGSVMPGPVGANPSLTIAAFADRAAQRFSALAAEG